MPQDSTKHTIIVTVSGGPTADREIAFQKDDDGSDLEIFADTVAHAVSAAMLPEIRRRLGLPEWP